MLFAPRYTSAPPVTFPPARETLRALPVFPYKHPASREQRNLVISFVEFSGEAARVTKYVSRA